MQMQKKGLEDMKQEKNPSCQCSSCEACWQSCLDSYCFHCSREVEEVEDITSPKACCGKNKVPNHSKMDELVTLQEEKTSWCSSCSPCCQKKSKKKRELALCQPEKINLDDLDPTLVFEKKKAMQDHDQVPYRREDDLTVLDYLEAGWPVQVESQKGCRCFPCLRPEKTILDTKQKGKANSSCCPSPCGDERKGADLKEFSKTGNPLALANTKQKGKEDSSCCRSPCGDKKKRAADLEDTLKTDNSLALGGTSSGTLVWDKPPPVSQQDLSKNSKEDQPEVTPTRKNPQIHDNLLFTQGSTAAILNPKDSTNGQPPHPPISDAEPPKAKNLPQGWSWLMENSNSPNTPKHVDKEPDVQTRYVQILPEIVDMRFQLKNKDDMDTFQKRGKLSTSRLKYKESEEDHVETSLVQFAKPEIVDKRFQWKSKDDILQKKEESSPENTEKRFQWKSKDDILQKKEESSPENTDKRFQWKSKDDILQKKEENFPKNKDKRFQWKSKDEILQEKEENFPENDEKRFQLKSKDDIFHKKEENMVKRSQFKSKDDVLQKREEKFQIIEEDVERLGAIHNKLGILQQQLLQKEQILVLEERLKEQGHLQWRKEELALEKEHIELLREKIQGKGHLQQLEKKNEELVLEKEKLAFLREVMNEKGQLERQKEEFINEKKQLQMLRERLCQMEKNDFNLEKQQLEALQRQSNLEEKEKLKMKEKEIALERENLNILRQKLTSTEKVQIEMKKDELYLQLEKTKEELAREKEQLKAMQERLYYQEKGQIEKSKLQLALEKEQLEELRDKLNLKDKEQLKKKREELDNEKEKLEELKEKLDLKDKEQVKKKKQELDNEKEQLEMLKDNLSSHQKALVQKKKLLLTNGKGELQLQSGKFSDKEKDVCGKSNLDPPSRDSMKNSKDSNGSEREQEFKEQIRNPNNPPLRTQRKKYFWESGEKKKERTIQEDWEDLVFYENWEVNCQSKSYDNFVRSCIGGFRDSNVKSNNQSPALKKISPTKVENQEKGQELFEIENKRPGGNSDLTMIEKKEKYGILEKRYKGKQHIEHHLEKETGNNDDVKRKEDSHDLPHKRNHEVCQVTRGVDDLRKRPRAILEFNDHDNQFKFLGLEGSMYHVERPNNSMSLEEDENDPNDDKRPQHKTIKSNELAYQYENKSAFGPAHAMSESNHSKGRQLLSYNFDPPKKRSEFEPHKKKAKKSDDDDFVPINIAPPCGGSKFTFSGWKSTCGSNVEEGECSSQQHTEIERVVADANVDSRHNHEKKGISAKSIKNKPEPSFEKPRIKARFRFRGSLDKKAQNEILGKLKELELEDLKHRLAEKKKLLERLENVGTSKSRQQKSI